MKKPELIMPAGSFEKLKYAFAYGADATYAGLPDVSLRARLNSFDINSLKEAIIYSHNINKKIYIAINLIAHENDLSLVEKYVKELSPLNPDAFIISDPGILKMLKDIRIDIPIHLSTQANTTNSESILFWKDQGVKRIIMARELNYEEIMEIGGKVDNIEIEIFVHGAMCMSYSGRCILSNFFTGRDSNRGNCAQPCRWKYYLVEETRKCECFEIDEDKRGTYILNSKDLCLIDKIDLLEKLNISGYKVEGRTKNIFYVSLVAKAYRNTIDNIFDNKKEKILANDLYLLNLTDNHGFTYGFMFKNKKLKHNIFEKEYKKQNILGLILSVSGNDIFVKVKNPISIGDKVICISPKKIVRLEICDIFENEKRLKTAYGSKKHFIKASVSKKLLGKEWDYGIIAKE